MTDELTDEEMQKRFEEILSKVKELKQTCEDEETDSKYISDRVFAKIFMELGHEWPYKKRKGKNKNETTK